MNVKATSVAALANDIRSAMISGREIHICDNMIDAAMVNRIATIVKSLHYVRREKSRPGVPGLASVSDIAANLISGDAFLRAVRMLAEKMFQGERFTDQRVYVNSSVFGDGYYTHRDCGVQERHVTALYYANLGWQTDWGGETIYFNDQEDAELVVAPKPGRLVIARGAILHRGGVPTRVCHEERFTLAYKLTYVGPSTT
jgi:SM-20-related protein